MGAKRAGGAQTYVTREKGAECKKEKGNREKRCAPQARQRESAQGSERSELIGRFEKRDGWGGGRRAAGARTHL